MGFLDYYNKNTFFDAMQKVKFGFFSRHLHHVGDGNGKGEDKCDEDVRDEYGV